MRKTSSGGLRFPTGLLFDVFRGLKMEGVDLETIRILDKRREPGERMDLPWLDSSLQLRPYQEEAVEAAMEERWPISGRGILRLPIRSGKTVIAAKLFQLYGLRGTFVVTSQLILRQTQKLFERVFGASWVGVIGDGEWRPSWITVATIQSLQSGSKRKKEFLKAQDVLIVDEVHHMEGDKWRKPILDANAGVKLGLSATVRISRKLSPKSAIYLQAATGPLIFSIPIKRLVDEGWLLSPKIFIMESEMEDDGDWSQSMYHRNIVNNSKRNKAIVEACKILTQKGHRILVDVGRLAHIKILYGMIKGVGLRVAMAHYKTGSERREAILDQWKKGDIQIVVGTILGEGVDIPELSAVVNAEGGQSWISCIQRLRNLTIAPDKKEAILIDSFDSGNSYLERHSKARLKVYSQEESFNISGPYKQKDFFLALSAGLA